MEKFIRIHLYSVGAWLLALTTVLVLANLQGQPSDYVPVRDPFFGLRLPVLYWIAGGISLVAAVYCLFGRQTGLQLGLVLWLAANMLVASLGLRFMDAKGGLRGYLGEMSDVFGMSTGAMSWLLTISMGYLFIGSLIAVAIPLVSRRIAIRRSKIRPKMACAWCGGHLEFALANLGQKISCPQCARSITLRRPDENLKIACFFCGGHIEFPPHAIGEKMPCPHCKMDITLKEPS